ncbi:MAG: hypothetical protein AAGF95_35235 [Chloroflexota bacterium]
MFALMGAALLVGGGTWLAYHFHRISVNAAFQRGWDAASKTIQPAEGDDQ